MPEDELSSTPGLIDNLVETAPEDPARLWEEFQGCIAGIGHPGLRQTVQLVFDEIGESLVRGDTVKISSFGSFYVREKGTRMGRNPKTGTRVEVPAKKIPYFKPSKELKDLVNTESAAPAAEPMSF